MNEVRLKTLIVDDSMVFRKILSDLVKPLEFIEIVGQAPNGKLALIKIQNLRPDLILLDLDMPEMNGLQLLEEMKRQNIECSVIIISGASAQMQKLAIKALNAGAFEFIAKPVGETIEETRNLLESDLMAALHAFLHRRRFRCDFKDQRNSYTAKDLSTKQAEQPAPQEEATPLKRTLFSPDLIVIGISTGGPPALMNVFSDINKEIELPIVIVQHIPANFSEALAESIREKSGLNVSEIADKMPLNNKMLYIAPGGRHVRLTRAGEGKYRFRIEDGEPVNNCRPSVDYFLESVTNNFSGKTAFFIMTGMGIDGLAGARLIKQQRGYVIAQSKDSCVVYGMPKVVVEAGLADEILNLKEIRTKIERLSLHKQYQTTIDSRDSEINSEKEVNKNGPEVGKS